MIVDLASSESPPVADRSRSGPIAVVAIVTGLVVGLLGAAVGPIAVVGVGAFGLFGVVAWRPVLATYLYLATVPFLSGIERGMLVPLVRPNEALLALLIAGAMAGGYIRALRGAPLEFRLHPMDVPLGAFLLLATVWPIASMLLRGVPPQASDLAAVLPACKLAGLFLLVRVTVRSEAHVLWCIRIIIGGAVGVATIAVLQRLGVAVSGTLATWWPAWPEELDRATTTLANAFATGDYILIGLTVLVTSGVRGLFGRRTIGAAWIVLAPGLWAVSQFSVWLAALLVGALLVRRLPTVRGSAPRLAPIIGLALLVGVFALLDRLEGFSQGAAPKSWLVRQDNLTHLYLPQLVENARFLIGVSPNSVLVPPDTAREVVFLESGYLNFLWVGGVPLLIGFVVLSWSVLVWTRRLSSRADAIGACASALAVIWWMVLLLSVFDSHLFMRGPGDVIFTLLGIVTGLALGERANRGRD